MTPTTTVVEAARACPLLTRARAVAAFVDAGHPVTAKAVLRRADIPAACAATGLPDPGRVVSAAHVPALHRAWTAAQGAGIVTVGHRYAQAVTTTADAIDQWRHGVAAVLRAESDDPGRRGAAIVCTAALDVLTDTPGLPHPHFGDALDDVLDRLPLRDQMAVPHTFRRGLFPESGAAELLAECGAVDPTTRTVTPLGTWARPELDRPPAPRITWADDDALELRIDLDRLRPPVWRRVRLRAATTLTELHEIIRILFEWDGDHLHVFTADGVRYADPLDGLDGCADSDQLSLAAALPRPGARLAYRYDLGDCWDHTVLLETGTPAGAPNRPTCIDGRGDAPRRGLARRGAATTPPARSRRSRPAPGPPRGQVMTEQPGLFDLPDPLPTPPAHASRDRGRRGEHWTRTLVAGLHVVDSATLRDAARSRLSDGIIIDLGPADEPNLLDPCEEITTSDAAAVRWWIEPTTGIWPQLAEALRLDAVDLDTTDESPQRVNARWSVTVTITDIHLSDAVPPTRDSRTTRSPNSGTALPIPSHHSPTCPAPPGNRSPSRSSGRADCRRSSAISSTNQPESDVSGGGRSADDRPDARTYGPEPRAARLPARPGILGPWPAAPTIIGPAGWVEERGDRAAAEPAYRLALTAARRLVEEQALARRFRHAAVRLRAVSEAGQGRTAGSLPVLDPPS